MTIWAPDPSSVPVPLCPDQACPGNPDPLFRKEAQRAPRIPTTHTMSSEKGRREAPARWLQAQARPCQPDHAPPGAHPAPRQAPPSAPPGAPTQHPARPHPAPRQAPQQWEAGWGHTGICPGQSLPRWGWHPASFSALAQWVDSIVTVISTRDRAEVGWGRGPAPWTENCPPGSKVSTPPGPHRVSGQRSRVSSQQSLGEAGPAPPCPMPHSKAAQLQRRGTGHTSVP